MALKQFNVRYKVAGDTKERLLKVDTATDLTEKAAKRLAAQVNDLPQRAVTVTKVTRARQAKP